MSLIDEAQINILIVGDGLNPLGAQEYKHEALSLINPEEQAKEKKLYVFMADNNVQAWCN